MSAIEERLRLYQHRVQPRASALPPEDLPAPEILDSWARCEQAGLALARVPEVIAVTDAELRRRRDASGLLRRLALAELETLQQQIAGSNFLLAFGDPDGVILDLCTDHRFATSSSGAGIVLGSRWSEADAGTNGLGTALAAGRPVSVNGPDHYLLHFSDIACTACPIRDAWGQVVGVLDASSYFESRQRHTQALVQMSTTHIENLLLAHQMRDAAVLAIHPRAEFLGTLSAGLMAFDGHGALRAVNARARGLLAGLSLVPGTRFEVLFDSPFDLSLGRLMLDQPLKLRDTLGSSLVAALVRPAGARTPVAGARTPVADARTPVAGVQTPVARATSALPDESLPPARRPRPTPAAPSVQVEGQPCLVGDPAVAHALALVEKAVRLRLPVLIHGETGTGKELLARHAHQLSGRRGSFVAVNCAAMPAELFEAELFGHAPGAFTGARRQGHAGLIASADGGTLLLDELRDLAMPLQASLLRFLDDQMLRPLGSTRARQVDVQILAASHADLEPAVSAGRFRADLMYRLNTVRVSLPPLRERIDFADIVRHLLALVDPRARIEEDALALLARHAWPGNFRELRTVLTRAALSAELDAGPLSRADVLRQLPALVSLASLAALSGFPAAARPASALQQGATERVRQEFERTGGSVSQISRNLGISRTTVYRHLRESAAAWGYDHATAGRPFRSPLKETE